MMQQSLVGTCLAALISMPAAASGLSLVYSGFGDPFLTPAGVPSANLGQVWNSEGASNAFGSYVAFSSQSVTWEQVTTTLFTISYSKSLSQYTLSISQSGVETTFSASNVDLPAGMNAVIIRSAAGSYTEGGASTQISALAMSVAGSQQVPLGQDIGASADDLAAPGLWLTSAIGIFASDQDLSLVDWSLSGLVTFASGDLSDFNLFDVYGASWEMASAPIVPVPAPILLAFGGLVGVAVARRRILVR
jgi:hypothetical protein